MKTIQAVKCERCKHIHDIDSKDYIVVSGVIRIGKDKEVFFSEDGTILCKSCFFAHFEEIIEGTVYR